MKTLIIFLLTVCGLYGQLRLDAAGDAKIQGKQNLSSPGNSLFIGIDAGRVDDGNNRRNLFIGKDAGYSTIGFRNNIFIGLNSGYNNTSGIQNLFIGVSDGSNNTTGSNNTYFETF
jgi:trimeric autotransporter adhesin